MTCVAVPFASTTLSPAVFQDPHWHIQVGYVLLTPCRLGGKPNDHVILRITKNPIDHLMTPNAHFYGPTVFAFAVWHKKNNAVFLKIKDLPSQPTLYRRLQIILCQPNGQELPELSPQTYPSRQLSHCAVNRATFQQVQPEDVITLIPDPARVDPNGTPAAMWVYSLEDPVLTTGHPNAVRLQVQSVGRHFAFPSGCTRPYVVHGFPVLPKIVQPALFRDAGRHVAPTPITIAEQAQLGINRKRFHVRTDKHLVENEDFRIDGRAIRIVKKNATGYFGYLLCEK